MAARRGGVTVAFTILVGYDGRPGSRAAMDVALGLAERVGGRVLVAYLFEGHPDPMISAQFHKAGEEITKGALMAAANHGVPSEAIVAERPVVDGLIQLAEERCADLLAIGTSRESAFMGALVGSACHALVHRTTVPLIVVPPRPDRVG
jgi:nucleotide-binding universal stress UspA family protein